MKLYLPLLAAALALAACSPQEPAPAPAEPAASAPSASAPEAAAASEQAAAPRCEVVVSSNDQMKFDTDVIHISRRCNSFTIHLKHVGTMPKAAMGHNIVIAKHEDIAAVVKDGAGAGADGDFVKAGDERIVAHTKLIGGGEETSLSLNPAKLAEGDYRFVCSFPGHEGLMNGKVVLVD